MTDWIETELKLGLRSEQDWLRLRERLGPGHVVIQTNQFMDTPNRSFQSARIGVRLRTEQHETASTLGPPAPETLTLTVKGDAAPDSPHISRRIEFESSLLPTELEQVLDSGLVLNPWIDQWRQRTAGEAAAQAFLDRVEAAAQTRLIPFGDFTNRRETCRLDLAGTVGPVELEIDRTVYPGGWVDFEIELEFAPAKKKERDESHQETHRALVTWLARELEIQTFPVQSKLARLDAILST